MTNSRVKRYLVVCLAYVASWTALMYAYVTANRAYGTEPLTGNLPPLWWYLALAYFVLDVLLVVLARFIYRIVNSSHYGEGPFALEVAELIPLWLLFHLFLSCLDYPVYERLESVGLGRLETIVGAAFLLSGTAYVFRQVLSSTEPSDNQSPLAPGRRAVIYVAACVLIFFILSAFAYSGTHPLSREALMHFVGKR
jgi:hypothetical protein